MADVTDVKDLGSGVIDGKECDHLAFRAKDTDWQIWIAQGEEPYPCRYVITSKGVDQAPQFTLDVRDWKAGGAPARRFTFTPPAGATKMDVKDLETLKDTSDLPENYRIGEQANDRLRTLKIVCWRWRLVGVADPEAREEITGTQIVQRGHPAQASGRPSSYPGQRCWRRPPHDTPLRRRRI